MRQTHLMIGRFSARAVHMCRILCQRIRIFRREANEDLGIFVTSTEISQAVDEQCAVRSVYIRYLFSNARFLKFYIRNI